MTNNVVRLRRPDSYAEPLDPVDAVSIRDKAGIRPAAIGFDRIVRSHGLHVMIWHDISSQQPMVDAEGGVLGVKVFGLDNKLAELWSDQDKAVRSQLIRACRVESEPFWVNRHGFHSRGRNTLLAEIGLEDFEERSLVKAALVIPLHLPLGQVAAAIFTSTDETESDLSIEFAALGQMLASISRRFVADYVRVMRDNPYLPKPKILTNREVQCLRWAAFGKTDSEIGTILGCSHATVRYHIKRVCDKFEASNRAQSIFRASQLGYLGSMS